MFIIYPNFALHKNYAFYYTSSFCRLFIASAECNSFCVCTKIKNKLYTMRNLLIGYCMKDSKSKMLGKKSMTSYISTQRYCYIYFSFVMASCNKHTFSLLILSIVENICQMMKIRQIGCMVFTSAVKVRLSR